MAAPPGSSAARTPQQLRAVYAILAIACAALIFDGYDIVVYGTIVSGWLENPSLIGETTITAAQAGTVGSYALIGVMIGALAAGAIGDHIGRRRMVLASIAWFSIGMALTATSPNLAFFSVMRLLTGLGLGSLLAVLGALVAEFAPTDRKNQFNAIVYSGIPAGGVVASLVALVVLAPFGWRTLFMIGALPLVTLLPLAFYFIPESPKWLETRGRRDEAEKIAALTGVALEPMGTPAPEVGAVPEKVGFAGLFGSRLAIPTLLLGMMSFSGLLLTYGLNTWLPKIMQGYDKGEQYSLFFLLLLNAGAVIGGLAAAWAADRFFGPQKTIVFTFFLAALTLFGMTFRFPDLILFAFIFIAGTGTLGTQVLIYGKVSNFYATKVRAAGVAWCAGFGRLGGIFGPVIGGAIVGAFVSQADPTAAGRIAFWVFAGVAMLGAVLCALVPQKHSEAEREVAVARQALAADQPVGSEA
ncbi:AAHS family benzoate transporter-like MFS transporter [Propioniferax innocua]|uniref:AAHS family benzoate transporter-like MFS transporter n=1 Tax=Propioniferax innocua TaxID=1753 RepID=A0A542ZPH2_9ACTN|nr:AAHS family benzoate transporter-like MFS transporter [Propioniferax innocua]